MSVLSDMSGNNLTSMSGLKSAAIPGANPAGFSGMGNGKKVDGPQFSASAGDTASIVFGTSVSGQIVLNLMGACPYFDDIDDRNDNNGNELSNYLVANLVYSWESAIRRGYTAAYNLSHLLTKIEKKSQKGGFFSATSAHSILDAGDSSEWFSTKFNANSSHSNYDPQKQAEITRAVKEELFNKAFREFAILNAGAALPPPVPHFLTTGAGRAASELGKCWHLYCQAGSALLGVANSIWGRSEAVAAFHRNNKVWVTEKVNGIEFVERSGSLSFRNEQP